MCALVHHVSAVVSRSRGDDGRARRQSRAFDDPSVGHSLRSGVREALEPILASRWHVVAIYHAVDKQGKTVDFLLRRDRGIAAAQACFRKALATNAPRVPRKVTLDGHVPSRRALWLLRREHPCWRNVKVRTN